MPTVELPATDTRYENGDGNAIALVVVTGASEGIGLAVAHRFAGLGRDVILVARRAEPLQAAADGIARRHGVRAVAVALDITTPEAAACIAAAAEQAGGFVDVLVNNAGIGLSGGFAVTEVEAIEALLDLNIRALTRLTRHFLPGMRARRRGGIVNVASLAGYTPGPWQAVYYASKAYVISLSEALAEEVAADNVQVTVVAPGPVETGFHGKMGAESSLYRRMILAPGPQIVAWSAVTGYRFGLRLVLPDVWSLATMPFLRIIPHRLLCLMVGWLLKPRGGESGDKGRGET